VHVTSKIISFVITYLLEDEQELSLGMLIRLKRLIFTNWRHRRRHHVNSQKTINNNHPIIYERVWFNFLFKRHRIPFPPGRTLTSPWPSASAVPSTQIWWRKENQSMGDAASILIDAIASYASCRSCVMTASASGQSLRRLRHLLQRSRLTQVISLISVRNAISYFQLIRPWAAQPISIDHVYIR
jgi:hypothetical protein